MRGLLVVGGLDPSGGAGITVDVQHAHDVGVWALPVAAALTVQDPDRFDRSIPVEPEPFTASLEAASRTMPIGAAKTGLLGGPAQVEYLSAFLASLRTDAPGLPIVVDPVVRATAADGDAAKAEQALRRSIEHKLLPLASLVTPNRDELALLSGQPVTDLDSAKAAALVLIRLGAQAVHVKGALDEPAGLTDLVVTGDDAQFVRLPRVEPGRVHGTGCVVATRAAAHRMLGRGWPEACALAALELVGIRPTARFGRRGAHQALLSPVPLAGDDDASETVQAVERIVPRLLTLLPAAWVAECGNNVAYAPAGATAPHDAATLRERIRLRDGRPQAAAAGHHAPTSHVARVALAAATREGHDGGAAALNLRADPRLVAAAEIAGLTVGRFARADQPEDAPSSVEWGTSHVLRFGVVDLVTDDGGPGKEPMMRLLADDPEGLITKLEGLVMAAHEDMVDAVATR